MCNFVVVLQDSRPTFADAPGLVVLAAIFLVFAAIGIFRPERLRRMVDLSDRTWHQYRMPLNLLRWVVGTVGIAFAALLAYMAFLGFTR
jgi:multisubunit Na+/H+ antiporter MnhG subunit